MTTLPNTSTNTSTSTAAEPRYLGYATNNRYPSAFPPLMADGRSVFSSWDPESAWNRDLARRHGLDSNWKYREYLIRNAEKIMEAQYLASCNDSGSALPRAYAFERAGGGGGDLAAAEIGTAARMPRARTSDLRSLYLDREQLLARKFTPSLGPPPA